MTTWYSKPASMGQALIIEENGEAIAVAYKEKDAPVLAAAPELLELAKQIVLASEEGEAVPDDIVAAARAAIAKARGE